MNDTRRKQLEKIRQKFRKQKIEMRKRRSEAGKEDSAYKVELPVPPNIDVLADLKACRDIHESIERSYREGRQKLVAKIYRAMIHLLDDKEALEAFLTSAPLRKCLNREPTKKDRENIALLVAKFVVNGEKLASKYGRAITALLHHNVPADAAVEFVRIFGIEKLAREASKKRQSSSKTSGEASGDWTTSRSGNDATAEEPNMPNRGESTSRRADDANSSVTATPLTVVLDASNKRRRRLLEGATDGEKMLLTVKARGTGPDAEFRLLKVRLLADD